MKEIYITMKEVVKVNEIKTLKIKDIASCYAPDSIMDKILNLNINIDEINKIGSNKFNKEESSVKKLVIDSLAIIKIINNNYIFVSISIVGNDKTLVIINDKKENKLLLGVKIVIGSLITFFGSFVAIMTFQTDVSLPDTLQNIYVLLTGTNEIKPYLIQLPYSVGIAIGSITFFMKFKDKSISPLEIEIDKYEKDIKDSEIKMIEHISMIESKENKEYEESNES